MALSSLASDAKRRVVQKRDPGSGGMTNFVDGSKPRPAGGYIMDGEAKGADPFSNEARTWHDCIYLEVKNNHNQCKHFSIWCKEAKCPKKFMAFK